MPLPATQHAPCARSLWRWSPIRVRRFRFLICSFSVPYQLGVAFFGDLDVVLWSCLRFFLECVQHINGIGNSSGINDAKDACGVAHPDFLHTLTYRRHRLEGVPPAAHP